MGTLDSTVSYIEGYEIKLQIHRQSTNLLEIMNDMTFGLNTSAETHVYIVKYLTAGGEISF